MPARVWQAWQRFWFAPAAPTNLAACRVLFFGWMFLFYAARGNVAAWTGFPEALQSPIALFELLSLPIPSAAVLDVLTVAWQAALLTSCLGLFSRTSMALACLLGLYLLGIKQSMIPHTTRNDGFVVAIMIVLALSRAGDGLSLDALIRRRRGLPPAAPEPSGEYTWPLRGVWMLLALVLFSAGLAKLRHGGLEWIWSNTLASYLVAANIPPGEGGGGMPPWGEAGLWLSTHPWLCRLTAAGAVAAELLYPVALFWRPSRKVLLPGACLMLVVFWALIGPPSVRFAYAHIFWIPWDRLWDAVQRRKA